MAGDEIGSTQTRRYSSDRCVTAGHNRVTNCDRANGRNELSQVTTDGLIDASKAVFPSVEPRSTKALEFGCQDRLRPLAVSYKTAGRLIDRSARTIRRMVDRGELEALKGKALVCFASLEEWVAGMKKSEADEC